MNQAIQQWRVFLWGRAFTIITDCRALQWLDTYEGENTAVCRLKFGIIGYSFRVCHRHRHLNEYPDSLSQLVINTYLCPNITGKYSDYTTLNEYYYLAHKFKLDSPSPTDHITPDKLPGFRRKNLLLGLLLLRILHHHSRTQPSVFPMSKIMVQILLFIQ